MRALALISLLLSLLTAPALAQEDDDGGGFLERQLEGLLSSPGRDVTIRGFAGALSSRARFDTLTMADADGVWLRISDVTLDWTRSALLRGRVAVNALTAREIEVLRQPLPAPGVTPEMAEAQPFSLPELPVSINIGTLDAETIRLGAPLLGEELSLTLAGSLSLGGGAGAAELDLSRLDGRGGIMLDAGFDNESRVLKLDLSVDEDPGGIAASLLNLPGEPAIALTVAGEAPLSEYAADLALATDGTDRLTGRVTLAGDDAGTRFEARLDGDLTPLMAEDFRPFFGTETALDLRGVQSADGALGIEQLSLSAAQLTLEGSLALDAAGWPRQFDLSGRVGNGDAPVRLPVAGPPVTLGEARIAAAYDAESGDRWRADIALDALTQDDLSIGAATLDMRGRLGRSAPRGVSALAEFALSELDIADPDLARAAGRELSGHASIDWTEGEPLLLRGLRVVSGAVTLAAQGEIEALAEGLPVSGTARLDAPDLSRFAALAGQPDLAGAAGATLTGSGSLLGGDFDITIDAETDKLALGIAQVDALVAPPGTLTLKARRDTEGTALEQLRIVNDAVEADVAGRLDGQSGELSVRAALSDLALADRRLDGAARLEGGVGWQSGGEITLSGVEATAMGAEITASGTFAPEAEGLPASGRVTIKAEDLARFAEIAGTALSGRIDATLSGDARGGGERLDIALDAKGRGLGTGIADLDRLIGGRLDLAARAGRSPERITVSDISLTTPQLSLTAQGDGAGGPIRISSRLANLGLFLPEFPGAVTTDGTVTLTGPDARRIGVSLRTTGPGGASARLTGDIRELGQDLDLAAAGSLPLALVNRAIQPNALAGTADFDLKVKGAPGLGAVSGRVATNGTRVVLPGATVGIDDLSGAATIGQSRVRTDFTARLRDGGTVRISGPVDLTPGYAGDLTINLDRITLTDRLIYTTTADGTVTVRGPLTGGAAIGGRIDVGKTEIRIPSGLGPASASLPGLRHVREPAAVRRTRERAGLVERSEQGGGTARPFPLDLTINAPDRIFVRGRGLDAELGGRLRVRGTTAAVEPAGGFELRRGRIDILGKRLTLTEGRVTMQGSLDPYLLFVAETATADTEIEVTLEGLASAPEVSFSSNPDLPEEEVVSRLIFGRGLDNISAIQAAQLASAVATLSGGGGGLVGRLRGGLGLSNLDVSQTAEGDTEVSAGAYLSDDIYTEITADSSGKQEINLNLDLTRSLTAKGTTSSEGDAGVGLFFERDY